MGVGPVLGVLLGVLQVSDSNSFLTLAPAIVNSAVAAVRPATITGKDSQPALLVNVKSFLIQGSMTTGTDLDSNELAGALRRPFESTSPGRAFECRKMRDLFDCHVRHNGLYIELNCLSRNVTGYEAVVTAKYTGPRRLYGGRMIDFEVFRIRFVSRDGQWIETNREVLSQS